MILQNLMQKWRRNDSAGQPSPGPEKIDNKGNKPHSSGEKSSIRYLAVLALLLILPYIDILAAPTGRVLGEGACDNPSAYYFLADYAAGQLKQGSMPLWNPLSMLGLPFVGDGEGSIFHPLFLFFLVMPTGMAINWLIASSFVLTGLFFYGYLRSLELCRKAAFCGALVWCFSNAMVSRIYAGHLNILLSMISMPLILMLWEKYRRNNDPRLLAGIALSYGLMLLAYYPQITYIFSLFFMLYVLFESGQAIRDRHTAGRETVILIKLGGAILVGIGLASVQLFPALDFVSQSFRQHASIEFSGMFSFPPENFLTLVAPEFFGTRVVEETGRYWGRHYFWEMWIYLGILPLIMTCAGALVAPAKRRRMLLFCAAVFLILGLGKYTPLFPFIYNHIPMFNVFRGSSKNTLMTLLVLIILSAHGFDGLLGCNADRRRRVESVALPVTIVLGVGVLGLLVYFNTTDAWGAFLAWIGRSGESGILSGWVDGAILLSGAGRSLLRALLLTAAALTLLLAVRWKKAADYLFAAVVLLILIDLGGVFLPLQRTTFDEASTEVPSGLTRFVRNFPNYPPRLLLPEEDRAMPNLAMKYGYSSAFGYMSNTLKRYNTFISLAQNQNPRASQAVSKFMGPTPFLRLLAFDAVAMAPGWYPADVPVLAKFGNWALVDFGRVSEKIPRAFLAASPRYMTRDEALEYVLASGRDVVDSPAIERDGQHLAGRRLAADMQENVRFISWSPQRIELEAVSLASRELILCEMYEKNWLAVVNGEQAEVVPANYIFRAVQIPAGVSRVVFRYRPKAFYWGGAVSLMSLLIIILLASWKYFPFGNAMLCREGTDGADNSPFTSPQDSQAIPGKGNTP